MWLRTIKTQQGRFAFHRRGQFQPVSKRRGGLSALPAMPAGVAITFRQTRSDYIGSFIALFVLLSLDASMLAALSEMSASEPVTSISIRRTVMTTDSLTLRSRV